MRSHSSSRRKFLANSALAIGSVTAASILSASSVFATTTTDTGKGAGMGFPVHPPMGNALGLHPERVSWVHDPGSVSWDGTGYWWQVGHFDEQAIATMVKNGIKALAGAKNASGAWTGLFQAHNSTRNIQGGFCHGQKIAIKTNINGAGAYGDDRDGQTHEAYTNPVVLKALLLSLVDDAGVAPEAITVYDATRIFPGYMMELCTKGRLAGVRFRHRYRDAHAIRADLAAPVTWSRPIRGTVNHLPECVVQADYLINLANLKGHSWGITLCGKNHFGSFMNSDPMRAPQAAGLHPFQTAHRMGEYSPLVDLLANRHLGGKTVLNMLDGIIVAPGESVPVTRANSLWQLKPFNNHFTASLFFSQDPVAIDSVGADFLMHEPTVQRANSALRNNPSVENYLHEAALAGDPPSGSIYRDGFGNAVGSLGTHDHWNNPDEKLYSRNLGLDQGIELVRV